MSMAGGMDLLTSWYQFNSHLGVNRDKIYSIMLANFKVDEETEVFHLLLI